MYRQIGGGVEYAWGKFNATAATWGRWRCCLADDGARDGKANHTARNYLLEATDSVAAAAFAPRAATPYYGYAYQFPGLYPRKAYASLVGRLRSAVDLRRFRTSVALIISACTRCDSTGYGYVQRANARWRGIVERYGTW